MIPPDRATLISEETHRTNSTTANNQFFSFIMTTREKLDRIETLLEELGDDEAIKRLEGAQFAKVIEMIKIHPEYPDPCPLLHQIAGKVADEMDKEWVMHMVREACRQTKYAILEELVDDEAINRLKGASNYSASSVIAEISAEIERATAKFPTWPTDPIHAFAVVGEEFGETQKEVLQLTYEPHKSSKEAVRKEAIQLAAMSIRFLMSLDRYKYTPLTQHSQ
jgi:hypothetical protein